MNRNTLRNLRIVLWGLVLIVGAAASWFFLLGPGAGPAAGRPPEVAAPLGQGDYRLVTTDGEDFTQDDLVGQPSLMFFGYTHCPDVCPTTLGDIAGWKDDLGPEGEALRVFFVTVDPERDTVEELRDYVGWLPGGVGITGTPDEMTRAFGAFRIYARKVPQEGGGYSMDHSAYVMLFDRNGTFDQVFTYQQDPEDVVAKLRRVLADGA